MRSGAEKANYKMEQQAQESRRNNREPSLKGVLLLFGLSPHCLPLKTVISLRIRSLAL